RRRHSGARSISGPSAALRISAERKRHRPVPGGGGVASVGRPLDGGFRRTPDRIVPSKLRSPHNARAYLSRVQPGGQRAYHVGTAWSGIKKASAATRIRTGRFAAQGAVANMIRQFQFEAEIYQSLSCVPMQARRKLDAVGIKVHLAQWQQL